MGLGARGEKGAPIALIQASLQPQGLSLGPVNSPILQESPGTFKGSFKGLSLQMSSSFTFAHGTLEVFLRGSSGCVPCQLPPCVPLGLGIRVREGEPQ